MTIKINNPEVLEIKVKTAKIHLYKVRLISITTSVKDIDTGKVYDIQSKVPFQLVQWVDYDKVLTTTTGLQVIINMTNISYRCEQLSEDFLREFFPELWAVNNQGA
jgi:hypothetical protein